MKLGYIGLGKMGANMVERLLGAGHEVVVYDTDATLVASASKKGALPVEYIEGIVSALSSPRLVWLMVPYERVDEVLSELIPLLEKGDTVIDGGNSPYKETMRRAAELTAKDIGFLDAGVSGGPGGARTGACIMVGGPEDLYKKHEQLFQDISKGDGYYRRVGEAGAGHFVKMVHNGIEYGMMQAIAEGTAVLKESSFNLNLEEVANLYNHGSVVESRLVGWLEEGFKKYGSELKDFSGSVGQTGEGLWTVEAARELGVPTPVIEMSVKFRKGTEVAPSYTGKVLQVLRQTFGGHGVK